MQFHLELLFTFSFNIQLYARLFTHAHSTILFFRFYLCLPNSDHFPYLILNIYKFTWPDNFDFFIYFEQFRMLRDFDVYGFARCHIRMFVWTDRKPTTNWRVKMYNLCIWPFVTFSYSFCNLHGESHRRDRISTILSFDSRSVKTHTKQKWKACYWWVEANRNAFIFPFRHWLTIANSTCATRRSRRCSLSKECAFWTTTAIAFSPNTTTKMCCRRWKSKRLSRKICSTKHIEPHPRSLCWTDWPACTKTTSTCFSMWWAAYRRTNWFCCRCWIVYTIPSVWFWRKMSRSGRCSTIWT